MIVGILEVNRNLPKDKRVKGDYNVKDYNI